MFDASSSRVFSLKKIVSLWARVARGEHFVGRRTLPWTVSNGSRAMF